MESFLAFLLFSALIYVTIYLRTHQIQIHRDMVMLFGLSLLWAAGVISFLCIYPTYATPINFSVLYLLGMISFGLIFISQVQKVSEREALFQKFGEKKNWRYVRGSSNLVRKNFGWSFLNTLITKTFGRNILQGTGEVEGVSLPLTVFEYLSGFGGGEDFLDSREIPAVLVCALEVPEKFPRLSLFSQGSSGLPWSKVVYPGWREISFEAHEFNEKFLVFTPDPTWGYECIQPLTMEVLLNRAEAISMEVKDRHLLFTLYHGNREVEIQDIEYLVHLAFSFYRVLPLSVKQKYSLSKRSF